MDSNRNFLNQTSSLEPKTLSENSIRMKRVFFCSFWGFFPLHASQIAFVVNLHENALDGKPSLRVCPAPSVHPSSLPLSLLYEGGMIAPLSHLLARCHQALTGK